MWSEPLLIFDDAVFQIVESMAESFDQRTRVLGGVADSIEKFRRADELDFSFGHGTRRRAALSAIYNNAHLAEDLAAVDRPQNDFRTIPPTQDFDASAANIENALDGVAFSEQNVATSELPAARHHVLQL